METESVLISDMFPGLRIKAPELFDELSELLAAAGHVLDISRPNERLPCNCMVRLELRQPITVYTRTGRKTPNAGTCTHISQQMALVQSAGVRIKPSVTVQEPKTGDQVITFSLRLTALVRGTDEVTLDDMREAYRCVARDIRWSDWQINR